MAKHTQVKAQNPNGNSLQLTQHETDSPVLPMAQLEQLQAWWPAHLFLALVWALLFFWL